ncbi:MAG: glycine--tRNA ligase subunit beta, partial [Calditerrivibrio sp.]|nr:glycine--tRNA ligase subunit beta [Calditerrivibrio sp.]
GKITADGTPRRLYVRIDDLQEKQNDQSDEILGPPASASFDKDGNFTGVALNFAKAKGLDIATLKKVTTPKGEYLAGIKFTQGKATKEIILDNIVKIIQNIPFKKTMKWGDNSFKFARPVKSFISLFDDQIAPFEIDGIVASNKTTGHRFHGNEVIEVLNPDDYFNKLASKSVIVSRSDRKKMIENEILTTTSQHNIQVKIDEDLLDTVTNLVEYPFAVLGSFNRDFLQLPEEVLITSMKNHQKYFYTIDKNGKITNLFIGISNTKPVNENIRKGYERVLRARLTDAMFFFENDKNIKLEDRVEELKKVIYQEKLGTSYEKMERFSNIASYLCDILDISNEDREHVLRTAKLCKADLMTEMVYEFPELQGVMGREYAKIQGENEQVYMGIFEHYLPKFSGDQLPKTISGAIVSISDKIDTICGCFAIGLIPSGNNDPYALRRNSIGILQIIRNRNFRINLGELIDRSLYNLSNRVKFNQEEVKKQIIEFILLRFKQILVGEGISPDAVDAVLNNYNDIIKIEKNAKAISEAKNTQSFTSIAQSYKRINNILKKSEHNKTSYNEALFNTDYEKKLSVNLNGISENLQLYLDKESYDKGLEILLTLEKPINEFFDNVMVMVEDPEIRSNRISLLAALKQMFDKMGDLSLIN